MKTKYLQVKSEAIFILVIVLINLIFTFFPLLNILSFETSVLNGILFAFISGLFWLRKSSSRINKSLKSILIFYFIIILIPFIILSFSTIICQQCPFSDGIFFYLILAFPSIIVGIAIAEFSLFISYKFRILIFICLYLIILLGFLPELYFNPQIYFYNPIFGYFPGVIYDENIQITFNLIAYRCLNLGFSLFILASIYLSKKRSKSIQLIVIIIITLLYLSSYFLKSTLGFATNINRIKTELKGKIETNHFIIYFPSSITENDKKLLLWNHLYFYNKNEKLLNTKIDDKITSIIFNSGAQKKRLFGAQNADVTKPWMNQFYINFDNYENSLNHELLHVFSKNFGRGLFNLPTNYNPGLVEGFATAFDNNYDNYDIDYLAFLAYKKNIKVSLKNLFSSLSFFSNASSLSYIFAGSFIKFLAREYSVEKIEKFYSNPNFKLIFGKDVQTLEKRYYDYLDSLKFEFNSYKANFYFGRVPLVKKYCARAAAKELHSAWELFNEEKFQNAEKLFKKIFSYSNSFSSLYGIIQCIIKTEEFNQAISLLEKEKRNFIGSSSYYNIEYLLAYLFARGKQIKNAITYYDSLIIQNPNDDYYNASFVYKNIAEKDSSEFYNFIENRDSRFQIIKRNLVYGNDAFLQYYIKTYLLKVNNNNSERKLNYKNEIHEIEKLLTINNYNSQTYFQIAKFSLNNLKLDDAIKFSQFALDKSDEERKAEILDFNKKVKWIKHNLNELNSYEF